MSFTRYMMEFYGPNGVYPELNFNETQVALATQIYKCRLPNGALDFVGDSVDRERVRDIILEARKSVLPEFAKI
jgi:hypothetical protein